MPTLEPICKRLFSSQSSVTKCLVSGVLLAIPVAHFLAFGVLYALIDQARRGQDPELPSWEGWRRLFVDGLVAFAIFVVLGAVPIAAGWIVSWPLRSLPVGPLRLVPLIPGLLIAAPLTAAGIYQYQRHKAFRAAFRLSDLAGMLQSCLGDRCANAGLDRIHRDWLSPDAHHVVYWSGNRLHFLREVFPCDRRNSQTRGAFAINKPIHSCRPTSTAA